MPGKIRHGQNKLVLDNARKRDPLVTHQQRLVGGVEVRQIVVFDHQREAHLALDANLHGLQAALTQHRELRRYMAEHPGLTAGVASEAEAEVCVPGIVTKHVRQPRHPLERHAPGQRLTVAGEAKRKNVLRRGPRHKRRMVITRGVRCQRL